MKFNNLEIINFLNGEYGSCIFCTLLSKDKCRYDLQEPQINKCDECYLFNSRTSSIYQRILRRYNNKEIKKNEN